MPKEKTDNSELSMLSIKAAFIDRMFVGLVVLGAIGAPTSALRALSGGWSHMYSVQLSLATLLIGVFFIRHRLSVTTKASVVIVILWAVGGLPALITFGFYSATLLWLTLACVNLP